MIHVQISRITRYPGDSLKRDAHHSYVVVQRMGIETLPEARPKPGSGWNSNIRVLRRLSMESLKVETPRAGCPSAMLRHVSERCLLYSNPQKLLRRVTSTTQRPVLLLRGPQVAYIALPNSLSQVVHASHEWTEVPWRHHRAGKLAGQSQFSFSACQVHKCQAPRASLLSRCKRKPREQPPSPKGANP